MSERHEVSGEVHVTSGVAGSASLIYLENSLLGLAAKLVEEEQPSMAIVVAHVACEAAVTRCMTKLFATRGADDLAEPVLNLMNGHTLIGSDNRALYRALTGDEDLTKQSFWKPYQRSIEWRNQIVHNGRVYGRPDAEVCVKAATEFVAHVQGSAGIDSGV